MSYPESDKRQQYGFSDPESKGGDSTRYIPVQNEYSAVPNVENPSTAASQIEKPNTYGAPRYQSFAPSAGENKKGGLTTSTFRGIRKEIEAKLAERHS